MIHDTIISGLTTLTHNQYYQNINPNSINTWYYWNINSSNLYLFAEKANSTTARPRSMHTHRVMRANRVIKIIKIIRVIKLIRVLGLFEVTLCYVELTSQMMIFVFIFKAWYVWSSFSKSWCSFSKYLCSCFKVCMLRVFIFKLA